MIFSLSTVKNKMRRNADQAVCHWLSTTRESTILFRLLSPYLFHLNIRFHPTICPTLGKLEKKMRCSRGGSSEVGDAVLVLERALLKLAKTLCAPGV